ncbi:MAG: hypothetical protein A3I54_02420 [Candidatus Levybacteria bacterium RIFCSPLOWO2_02_FULL_41_11]|nr:MAG: hypothetical protein A2869_03460 [Candidatus Levybacteria bacterium RIFCSPHIGHO2_01_FULL_40_58]OGH40922.1 MAG: hypothetical protein A2894_01395 [Candidatus Levybacteria bacterium RIFCSPLOWO2_01_FULL_40_64]OGH48608.1 MAG: hypothetical protein A3I54_02420 [Candidatus Levybacteria bacterium RIFCSPLOWO2_02_FULL_41_11]OGH54076.1 MAG: hypothetical protein A3G15_04140 [Candidatus Levybacteria bacterium RIFCSPLOWO2_12_FULL_40_10]
MHFGFGGDGFFLKKERVFFFRGSALQVFGQCGRASALGRGGRGVQGGNSAAPSRCLIARKVIKYKVL